MSKLDARIESPCHEDWDAMRIEGGGRRRRCEACAQSVHDLSSMSFDEADRFLQRVGDERVCIAYTLDENGEIEHRPQPPSTLIAPGSLVRRPAKAPGSSPSRTLAPALLAGALAACTPHGEPEQMPELDAVEAVSVTAPVVPTASPARPVPDRAPPEASVPDEEPCESTSEATGEVKVKLKGKRKRKRKGMRVRPRRDADEGEVVKGSYDL